jgi:hypothetical protein
MALRDFHETWQMYLIVVVTAGHGVLMRTNDEKFRDFLLNTITEAVF